MLACKTVSARGLARRAQPKPLTSRNSAVRCAASVQNDDAPSTSSTSTNKLPLMLASTFSPFLLEVGAAMAKDGEYGILEGRTFALIHPAVMVSPHAQNPTKRTCTRGPSLLDNYACSMLWLTASQLLAKL